VTPDRLPKGEPVPPPAASLPPQSFGRYDYHWGSRIVVIAVVLGLPFLLMPLHGFSFLDSLLFEVVCGWILMVPLLEREKRAWVAGGDGWLMLLQARKPRSWVRTDRLVSIRLAEVYAGEDEWKPHLTLRDDQGREVGTWLSHVPAEAAASLLAGIGRSAEDSLTNLDSSTTQAAVTALHRLAGDSLAHKPEALDG
jgi:hypothetical protein